MQYKSSGSERFWLFSAGAMFFLAAIFSVGYHHLDEHYQILEFAGYKAGITPLKHLCWEYGSRMRPALQPFIAWMVFSAFQLTGKADPFLVATVLRLMAASAYFLLLLSFYKKTKPLYGSQGHPLLLLFLLFFTWYGLYAGVRFSSENASLIFLLAALLQLLPNKEPATVRHSLLFGFFLAWSFHCRFQSGFFIAGLGAWGLFIGRWKWKTLLFMATGFLFAFLLSVCLDRWLYGEWVFTPTAYFAENILNNKAAQFGVFPWYSYFEWTFFRAIPPLSLFYMLGMWLFFVLRPLNLFTWMTLPFVLVHFVVPHKELRFLFPVIPFVSMMCAASWADLETRFTSLASVWYTYLLRFLMLINGVAGLWVMLTPADTHTNLYSYVYHQCSDSGLLVYDAENPYYKAAPIDFYKQPQLQVMHLSVDSMDRFPASRFLFVTQTPQELEHIRRKKKLLYSTFPSWMKNLDFNGINSRIKHWELYEIE